jgi:hypothetical protein
MSRSARQFSIRSFRDGDEAGIAGLYNDYVAKFFGPASLTGDRWRSQFREQRWTGPSVEQDKDCVRIAEQEGELLGYAVTDYRPIQAPNAAMIQELCAAEPCSDSEVALEVVHALIEDAEARALARGKTAILLNLSPDGGLAQAAAAAGGYETHGDVHQVFMAAVTDLGAFVGEIAKELTGRIEASEFRRWSGTINLGSGELCCSIAIDDGAVGKVTSSSPGSSGEGRGDAEPDIRVEVIPQALPLLLMGRRRAAELYLQDALRVETSDREEALRLLDTLFPRVPIFLPRAQWW